MTEERGGTDSLAARNVHHFVDLSSVRNPPNRFSEYDRLRTIYAEAMNNPNWQRYWRTISLEECLAMKVESEREKIDWREEGF